MNEEKLFREMFYDDILAAHGLTRHPPAHKMKAIPDRAKPKSAPARPAPKGPTKLGKGSIPRIPGESDRDYLERKMRIKKERTMGYGKPKTDAYDDPWKMHWEMGH